MIAPITARLCRWFSNISPDEIARQYRASSEEADRLSVASLIVYGTMSFLIPLEIAMACALVDMSGKKIHARLTKGVIPAQMPWRYIGSILAALVAQLAYVLAAHFVYHSDIVLAHPFAAILLFTTTLRISTVRCIHLPYGLSELALTLAVVLFEINSHWPSGAGPFAIGAAIFFLTAALNFTTKEVLANHQLHA